LILMKKFFPGFFGKIAAAVAFYMLFGTTCVFAVDNGAMAEKKPSRAWDGNGRVIGSIGYGTGECDILSSDQGEEGSESAMTGPPCFTVDRVGNIYVLDTAGKKVLRIDSKGILSCYFNFTASEFGDDLISDIAVTPDGAIYFLNQSEQVVYKFASDGKLAGTLGIIDERSLFSGLTAIATDEASNLFALDVRDPKVVVFDGEGKIVSRNIIKATGNGYAVSGVSVYTALLKEGRIVLADILSGAQTELKFVSLAGERPGIKIIGASLIGFDSVGRSYVKVAVADGGGKTMENSVVIFESDGTLYSRISIPVDSAEGREAFLGRRFLFLKDDAIIAYRFEQLFFKLIEYCVEK